MPMDLKNNPLTSFIRTSQSVIKNECLFCITFVENVTFRCPLRLYIRTTTIQYIYIYIYIYMYIYIYVYVSGISFLKRQKILISMGRRQYSIHMFFKYRRGIKKPSRNIRVTLSMILCKSLSSKCRKVSPFLLVPK